MYNPNQKPTTDDHVMTGVEFATLPIEQTQSVVKQLIELSHLLGNKTNTLEKQFTDLEVQRRTLLWLGSFENEEEKAEAMERVAREGLPPEVFASLENIHEGPLTLQ